jgi:hypothetical protein
VDVGVTMIAVEALMIDVMEATAQDEMVMETAEMAMALSTVALAAVACESLLILGLTTIRWAVIRLALPIVA